jgi:predicted Kef-type K+ transport protein
MHGPSQSLSEKILAHLTLVNVVIAACAADHCGSMSFFLFAGKHILLLMFHNGKDFKWTRGETLMSHWLWPVSGALLYLFVVALCKCTINQPVNVPKKLLSFHNLVLSIGSGIMFIGCLSSITQVRAD